MSTKLSYRVKPHATFGPVNQYGEGQVVELTPEEAKPFLDKLELIGEGDAPLLSDLPPLSNELNAQVPEELKLEQGIRLQDDLVPAKPKTQRKGKTES